MKMLAYGLVCAATLALVAPASAQVTIRDGHHRDGVSVRIGDNHHRHHHNGWRNSHAGCKVIKTRTHRPNGTVVIKTRRVCR